MRKVANSARKKRARREALYARGEALYKQLRRFTPHPHSYMPRKPERAILRRQMSSAYQASAYIGEQLRAKDKRRLQLVFARAAKLAGVPEYATDFSNKSEAHYLYIPKSKHNWTCIRFANHGIYYRSSGFCMQVSLRDVPERFLEQIRFIANIMLEALERGPDVPHPEIIKQARAHGKDNWQKFKFKYYKREDDVQDLMHANAVKLHHAELRQRGITPIRGPVKSNSFTWWRYA